MNTATRKKEALALLEQIENLPDLPGDNGKPRNLAIANLHILTVVMAGYTTVESVYSTGFFHVVNPDGTVNYNRSANSSRTALLGIRDYIHSVDACLTLPIAPEQWWSLSSGTRLESRPLDSDCCAMIKIVGQAQYARTLPIAMLKAWWSVQEG